MAPLRIPIVPQKYGIGDRSLPQNQPTTKKHDKHNNHRPNLHPKTSHPRLPKERHSGYVVGANKCLVAFHIAQQSCRSPLRI
ncbi:MAG: hypothetical protein F6K39_05540 [Okeania sp. SIO3B3]|nr:hypothetical protein [Okeania sp. SIO3B3]